MQACREAKARVNAVRSRHAKRDRAKGIRPNGGFGPIDDIRLERLLYNSKRRYSRRVNAGARRPLNEALSVARERVRQGAVQPGHTDGETSMTQAAHIIPLVQGPAANHRIQVDVWLGREHLAHVLCTAGGAMFILDAINAAYGDGTLGIPSGVVVGELKPGQMIDGRAAPQDGIPLLCYRLVALSQ